MFQREVLDQVTKGFAPGKTVYTVVTSFASTMLEPIILRYSLYPAKGTTIAKFAHNSDQMMLTHVCNGLFATLTLVDEAQKRNMPRLSRLTEEDLKIYVCAYAMHDIDKILGEGGQPGTLTARGTAEALEKMLAELDKINARAFLPTVEEWAGEILWLAVNTQRSRDINLSHSTFVADTATRITDEVLQALYARTTQLHTRRGVESALRDLCTFSDLVAFLIKSPEDALLSDIARRQDGIGDLIARFTDDGTGNHFSLVYHKLAEVRGLLSNQINNGAMAYMQHIYPEDQEPLIPYLYFPNGVVYLDPRNRPAPTIDRESLNKAVRGEIQESCQDIIEEGAGFGFNHLGLLKYPHYFHDFLNAEHFLRLFARKTWEESKANVAENTLQKMRGMQAEGSIPASLTLDYTPNERIAILGRFLINYLAILDECLKETAPHIQAVLEKRLIDRLGEEKWHLAQHIPSSGGVNYRYYWLAAQYLKENSLAVYESQSPGTSLEGLFHELINETLQLAGKALETSPAFQGPYLPDLADYVEKNLSFGFDHKMQNGAMPDFAGELTRYEATKKQRNSLLTCTICNSVYPVRQQEEASVLFQPWVYKNRLPLYKSENAGGICSICSLELMLRQVLFTDKPEERGRIKVIGKGYEDMELKYFFLYPGFFFTNQTYHLVDIIIRKMQNLKLYELCTVLRERERIGTADIVNLSSFNLTSTERKMVTREEKDKKEEAGEKGRMYLFDRYEAKQYPGFLFFAKKTFSKKKASGESTKATTASWVEAAWLGLALPLVTGARVVVTETYLPLFNSATDFMETVVLDAPHQSLRHLLPSSSARLRLDELYGHRKQEGDWIGGMMAALSRAIELHIDTERSGGDLKLERFTRIARDLATDQLYVFAFLKEQLRRDKLDRITGPKACHYNDIYRQFIQYYHAYEGEEMVTKLKTRHERVTELYLQFYLPFNDKGKWPTSHAIVRPVDIAARSIIKDTLNLSEDEIKLEMVHALKSWLEIVAKKGATGRVMTYGEKQDRQVWQFVETFYKEVFLDYAEGQRSLLNSRLNRFKGGCEEAFALLMYRRRQDTARQEESDGAEE